MNTTLPTMEQLIEILPILIPVLIIQIGLIIYCLKKVLKRTDFKFLNKKVWILIILFVQLFGPIAYLTLEREDN
ncbi:PLDc N-terminal domain-containing protein [Vagococcus fluvialis]|uniref:PLDc N-terminal domain-containing protein n=1 Tax=Vagococcus fluvialis TaxID=2738 RepID=UPI003B5B38F9